MNYKELGLKCGLEIHQQLEGKNFVYQGYYDTTCLVESDCEPPHEMSPDALYTALQLAALAEAEVFPVVQVMRKTIIDGSNTSGFQRTALLGRNGMITTSAGNVKITNISLEEDSCKIGRESPEEKSVFFRQ